jgi:hypothetical protein
MGTEPFADGKERVAASWGAVLPADLDVVDGETRAWHDEVGEAGMDEDLGEAFGEPEGDFG